MRVVFCALLLAAALPMHAGAVTQLELCERDALIHAAALDMFDAGVPQEDATAALLEANATEDPVLVRVHVSRAYGAPGTERGEAARALYVEICTSF
jgi:hypothetical protein